MNNLLELFDEKDCTFQTWPILKKGELTVGTSTGIKAVHLPTGISGISTTERTHHKNREEAVYKIMKKMEIIDNALKTIEVGGKTMHLQPDGTYKAVSPRIAANRAALAKGPKKPRRSKADERDVKENFTTEKATVVIGIDPGKKTGMGIYRNGELADVVTTSIIEAIQRVIKCHQHSNVMVYVEDARMATYGRGGAKSAAMAQGAGSIKRDCTIWEDELTRLNIPHKMVRPNKQSNKIAENKPQWQKLTGWTKRSSEHARDAVMIAMRFVHKNNH